MLRRIEIARRQAVPLPKITPYDTDAKARREYLTAFAGGYREVLAEVMIGCHMQVADGYAQVRLAGIADGERQAEKDHPEHYRRMNGIEEPTVPKATPRPRKK